MSDFDLMLSFAFKENYPIELAMADSIIQQSTVLLIFDNFDLYHTIGN